MFMQADMHKSIHVCMCACIIYVCHRQACMSLYIPICILSMYGNMPNSVFICACIYVCVDVCMETDMHESIHVYMHVCRHTDINLYGWM